MPDPRPVSKPIPPPNKRTAARSGAKISKMQELVQLRRLRVATEKINQRQGFSVVRVVYTFVFLCGLFLWIVPFGSQNGHYLMISRIKFGCVDVAHERVEQVVTLPSRNQVKAYPAPNKPGPSSRALQLLHSKYLYPPSLAQMDSNPGAGELGASRTPTPRIPETTDPSAAPFHTSPISPSSVTGSSAAFSGTPAAFCRPGCACRRALGRVCSAHVSVRTPHGQRASCVPCPRLASQP